MHHWVGCGSCEGQRKQTDMSCGDCPYEPRDLSFSGGGDPACKSWFIFSGRFGSWLYNFLTKDDETDGLSSVLFMLLFLLFLMMLNSQMWELIF